MPGLSDKQERFCREITPYDKLDACVRLGWVTRRFAAPARKPEGWARLMFLALCWGVVTEAPKLQIAAALAGLELVIPGFRKLVPVEITGPLLDRSDAEVVAWRKAVLRRDGYKCQACGGVDHLEAHHVVRWADDPTLRIVLGNGLTLCAACHKEVHHGAKSEA